MVVSDEHSDQENGAGLALHRLEGIDTDVNVNNDERKTLESQNTVENAESVTVNNLLDNVGNSSKRKAMM